MELLSTESAGVRTIRLVGNFERTDAKRFEDTITRAMAEGCVRIVVDMERVHLVCSVTIGALLHAQNTLRASGGELACVALSPFALDVFRTVGVDQRIRCYDTVEEGARALTTA